MDDKNLMEDILLLEKGVCDLYLHGTIESSTEKVHGTFRAALTESLCMQDTLYSKMANDGMSLQKKLEDFYWKMFLKQEAIWRLI